MTIWLIILWFVVWTVMGSFGGVLLDRWENLKSVLTGRSMCDSCKHPLSVKDLVPLVSYLSTKGKCRYCGVAIPVMCPLLELVMWAVFALTTRWVIWSGQSHIIISIIAWCLINWSLVLLVVHDHRTRYLHWTAWLVAFIVAIGYSIGRHSELLMINFWSSIILGGVFLLIYLCGYLIHWVKYGSREQGFGSGDVLTSLVLWWIAPLALWYDMLNMIGEWGILNMAQLVLGYLVISSTIGLIYWWILRARGEQEIEIAFLPGMIVWFWVYLAIVVWLNLFV